MTSIVTLTATMTRMPTDEDVTTWGNGRETLCAKEK